MKDYFKAKLGQKIEKVITTGEKDFTAIYRRKYFIEILKVTDKLIVEVSSVDIVPSGCVVANSEKYFDEVEVEIGTKTKTEIVSEIINKCDGRFIKSYNITIA